MQEMYRKIQEKKIDILDNQTLNSWIEDEIISLANDFDQRLSDEILLHICKRLKNILTTKYKSWYVGTIHAVFQTGLNGGYGISHKISVKTIFQWLGAAQNNMANLKADAAEAESQNKPKAIIPDSIETEFLIWASTNMLCLDHIDHGYDPLKEKKVSPGIRKLSEEYQMAKEMNLLDPLKNRLKNERLNLIEQ